MSLKNTVVGLGLLCAASSSWAAGIQRVPSTYPNSPILQSVTLPANSELTYLSGLLPDPVDPKAPKEQIRAAGNTESQAREVLRKVQTILASQGLTLGMWCNCGSTWWATRPWAASWISMACKWPFASSSAPRNSRSNLPGPRCKWRGWYCPAP